MAARVAAFALSIGWLGAQVAPASLAGSDGNASSYRPFDTGIGRFQQIHGALQGVPLTIRAIAWRRDAATPPPAQARWWCEFRLRMADGEYERATGQLTANYRSAPVTVVQRRRVVLPDWTQPAVASPAPFDFVLPLDVPYVHTGQHPLLWEVEVFDQSPAGLLGPVDAFDAPVTRLAPGTAYGVGCGISLQGHALLSTSNLWTVWFGEWPYQWSAPRFYAFGVADPNLALPVLCAPLRVDPLVVAWPGIGANYGFDLPYDPMLVGLGLRAQMLVPGNPGLRLTNAVRVDLPAMPQRGDREVLVAFDGPGQPVPVVQRNFGLVVEFR